MAAKKIIEIGAKTTGISGQLNKIERQTSGAGVNMRAMTSSLVAMATPAAAAAAAFSVIRMTTAEIAKNIRAAAEVQTSTASRLAALQSLAETPEEARELTAAAVQASGRLGGLGPAVDAVFALKSNDQLTPEAMAELTAIAQSGQVQNPKEFIDFLSNMAAAGGEKLDFQGALNLAARGGAMSQLTAEEFGKFLANIMPSGLAIGLEPKQLAEIFASVRGDVGERMRTGLMSAFSSLRAKGKKVGSAEDLVAMVQSMSEMDAMALFGREGVRGTDALQKAVNSGAIARARDTISLEGRAGQEALERVLPGTREAIDLRAQRVQRQAELSQSDFLRAKARLDDYAGTKTGGFTESFTAYALMTGPIVHAVNLLRDTIAVTNPAASPAQNETAPRGAE